MDSSSYVRELPEQEHCKLKSSTQHLSAYDYDNFRVSLLQAIKLNEDTTSCGQLITRSHQPFLIDSHRGKLIVSLL